jgi:hypothetical protein
MLRTSGLNGMQIFGLKKLIIPLGRVVERDYKLQLLSRLKITA